MVLVLYLKFWLAFKVAGFIKRDFKYLVNYTDLMMAFFSHTSLKKNFYYTYLLNIIMSTTITFLLAPYTFTSQCDCTL